MNEFKRLLREVATGVEQLDGTLKIIYQVVVPAVEDTSKCLLNPKLSRIENRVWLAANATHPFVFSANEASSSDSASGGSH